MGPRGCWLCAKEAPLPSPSSGTLRSPPAHSRPPAAGFVHTGMVTGKGTPQHPFAPLGRDQAAELLRGAPGDTPGGLSEEIKLRQCCCSLPLRAAEVRLSSLLISPFQAIRASSRTRGMR